MHIPDGGGADWPPPARLSTFDTNSATCPALARMAMSHGPLMFLLTHVSTGLPWPTR